jgi:hypothetical protein
MELEKCTQDLQEKLARRMKDCGENGMCTKLRSLLTGCEGEDIKFDAKIKALRDHLQP